MASTHDFIEAGHEYARQIAASNRTISTKPIKQWFAEIAEKAKHDEAIEEMTLDYNLSLLDGEDRMSEQEMAEIMEVGEVERSCWDCEYCAGANFDKDGVEIAGRALCCNIRKYNTLPEIVDPACGKKCAYFKTQGAEDFEPIFTAFVKAEKANQAIAADGKMPKYSDYDMMLKDDEIGWLKQRIEHLERENETLRAGLNGAVYDRRMSTIYGVNWQALRGRENEVKKENSGSL